MPSPGANSLTVDREVVSAMQELKKDFPPGVDSVIIYDPTTFITKSIHEVIVNDFRGNPSGGGRRIPLPAELASDDHPGHCDFPVSLVGTFTILVAFGISLNNLSLFGLVLAVGIVVGRRDRRR